MASSKEIRGANSSLSSFRSKYLKRGTRIHDNAAEDNLNRQRALDGICGGCKHFSAGLQGWSGNHEKVRINCRRGVNILSMYEQTPLGQDPDCPKFTPK